MAVRKHHDEVFAYYSTLLTSPGPLWSNRGMRNLLTIALYLLLSAAAWAQVDAQKVDVLCHAIARAEGFGVPHAIPTRYHNPGDLKSRPGITPLAGQKRIGKAGHIIFVDDAAGWAALRSYVLAISEGRRNHYVAHTTLAQLSRVYAQRWRPWLAQVTKTLGVPGSTRLEEFVAEENTLDFADGFCYSF